MIAYNCPCGKIECDECIFLMDNVCTYDIGKTKTRISE